MSGRSQQENGKSSCSSCDIGAPYHLDLHSRENPVHEMQTFSFLPTQMDCGGYLAICLPFYHAARCTITAAVRYHYYYDSFSRIPYLTVFNRCLRLPRLSPCIVLHGHRYLKCRRSLDSSVTLILELKQTCQVHFATGFRRRSFGEKPVFPLERPRT